MLFGALCSAAVFSTAETPPSRSRDLVCELSAFFTIDGHQLPIERRPAQSSKMEAEGRGLITCENSSGFKTEFPVLARMMTELDARHPREGEIALSANSKPFVLSGADASAIADSFVTRDAGTDMLFRGVQRDLWIRLSLTAHSGHSGDIKVSNLDLSFDESAPDIR